MMILISGLDLSGCEMLQFVVPLETPSVESNRNTAYVVSCSLISEL